MPYLVLAMALLALPASAAELRIEDAWVRALPPTSRTTAGYLRLVNESSSPATVIGASSPLAGAVEIHTMREVDGMMRMQRVREQTVAPGAMLELAPGGLHLMLFRLERMPAAGEQVDVCLQLAARDAPLCARADVLSQAPGGKP